MVGMGMVVPFLPFYIRQLGITDPDQVELWSGFVFAGPFFTSLFMTPIWGSLADRFGRKKMVIRALIGLTLSQILIGVSETIHQLFFFRLLQGAISGFIPAALALVSASSPSERSSYAIGILQTATSTGTVVGPLIGGIIADAFSFRIVFFITAGLCFLATIAVIVFVKETFHSSNKKELVILKNFKFAIYNYRIRYLLFSILTVQTSIAMTQPIFSLFIESFPNNQTHIATIAGVMFGITGVANAIAAPFWGKKNDSKKNATPIIVALIITSTAFGIHIVINSIKLLLPIRVMLGVGMAGTIPSFYSLINKEIPDEKKGGIMSIASSFTVAGNILGPVLSSLLLFFISINQVFLVASLFVVVILIINLNYIKTKSGKIPN